MAPILRRDLIAIAVHSRLAIVRRPLHRRRSGDFYGLHLPNGDDALFHGRLPRAGPTVVAYLADHDVTDIELMVATHGDSEHVCLYTETTSPTRRSR